MLILVASSKSGAGKSTCAVNLACELADLDSAATDRWKGEHSVVLVDADTGGTASRWCSGGHLPVSAERLSPDDFRHMDRWVQRMRSIVSEVDYVVVDGPSDDDSAMKAIVGASDLVVIVCSVVGAVLAATVPLVNLVRAARLSRSDGGPKCLLVPMQAEAETTVNGMGADLLTLGEPVGSLVHYWPEFTSAFNSGRWIGDFAPTSAAHTDVKTLAASVVRLLDEAGVTATSRRP